MRGWIFVPYKELYEKWNFSTNCGTKTDAFAKDIDVPDKNVGKMDEVSE